MDKCYICGHSEDMCDSQIKERTTVTDVSVNLCVECYMELELMVLPTKENLDYAIAKEKLWFMRECNLTDHDSIMIHLDLMQDTTIDWMEKKIIQSNMIMRFIKRLREEKQ